MRKVRANWIDSKGKHNTAECFWNTSKEESYYLLSVGMTVMHDPCNPLKKADRTKPYIIDSFFRRGEGEAKARLSECNGFGQVDATARIIDLRLAHQGDLENYYDADEEY